MPTDFGSIAYAVAAIFAAWVALDLGRRWIAHRVAEQRDAQRMDTCEKAIAKLAADFAKAHGDTVARVQKLEDKRTAENVSASSARTLRGRMP